MQHLNGNMESYGQIQFVNETESTLAGHPDYAGSLKRSAGDAGFDSDPEMVGHDMFDSGDGVGSPNSGPGGKKTRGRVKIAMRFIENKLRRYTTFSKRKTGIMKKAYELSTLTGTQVMLLVASETGHVYTFATRKLQPMITSESGKALIQTCLNSPDIATLGGSNSNHELDQSELSAQDEDDRMNPGGFEETGLNYTIEDDQPKTMVPTGGLSISPSPSPNPVHVNKPADTVTSDNHTTSPPPPLTTVPQTIAFNSYLSPPPQSVNGSTDTANKLTNMTMQLPTGGLAAFIPPQPAQGVTTVSTPQMAVSVSPTASTSPTISAVTPTQPTFATMVSAGTATPGATPLMYQTPQGMVYAGLPEGYVLNLPQPAAQSTSAAATPQAGAPAAAAVAAPGGQQPQYITIPVPVSLATGQVFQPFLAQAQQQVQQQVQQQQQAAAKIDQK